MAARRHRSGSHHRPAPITVPPPWVNPNEPSWFEREQDGAPEGASPSSRESSKVSTRGEGWVAPTSIRAHKCMDEIRALVELGRYEISAHVQSHMIEEGFDKEHCVGAVLGGRVLEVYVPPQQRRQSERFLVAGRFHLSARNTCPLHIVCEFFLLPAPARAVPLKPGATHAASRASASRKPEMEEHVRFVTAYIPRPPAWISPHVRAPR